MKYFLAIALIALSAAALASIHPADSSRAADLQRIAPPDPAVSRPSLDKLREAGPDGLRALLAQYDQHPDATLIPTIDAIAAQKDALWSRLYWYTDLDKAKAAARTERKPILYLRMLGKLTDEYSCANSRFFRTVLYANDSVSSLLRDRFILVWASERPVPVVTIDYGDGRVLKRTLTGNSIHYILDPQGNVVDALPGLYDPATFAAILRTAAETAASDSADLRSQHIELAVFTLNNQLQSDMAAVDSQNPLAAPAPASTPLAAIAQTRAATKEELEAPILRVAAPDAANAGDRAMTKRRVESPLLKAAAARPTPPAGKAAGRAMGKRFVEAPIIATVVPPPPGFSAPADADSPLWQQLAVLHLPDTKLDDHSIALIRSQNPAAYTDPAALAQVVDQFRRSIAADTVRNNLLFRRQILGWLLQSPTAIPLDSLNQRVYSELFLTPRSDPWLGLVPDSTYSALSNNGCSVTAAP